MSAETAYVCSRCNVECELRPMTEGSRIIGWHCPCCRRVTRTVEMIQADAEQRAAEKGITLEQLAAESDQLINPEPLDPELEAGLRALVSREAAEWKPACEHDTVNPYLPSPRS